jgi:hypothetical protein
MWGGYGRKAGWEVAIQAARLSQAAGVPVHVGWTVAGRRNALRRIFVRLTHHLLSGRVERMGLWWRSSTGRRAGTSPSDFLPPFMSAVMGADFGAYRGDHSLRRAQQAHGCLPA